MKKSLLLCLAALVLLGGTACEMTNAAPADPLPKVVMVTAEGRLGNGGFNDLAYDGVLRAASDYKIEVTIEEVHTRDEYTETVSAAALEGADLVIAIGDIDAGELEGIAEENPDTLFAVVDSEEEASDNVMSLSFKEEEGAFLMGVIAALTTRTHTLGFVGGVESKAAEGFEFGYRAGVKAINPDARVVAEYTDSFDDVEDGRAAALTLIGEGADVIFHAAGECGIGVIEAAAENGVWVIGIDRDQSDIDPEAVLCSMFKRVDNGVYLSIQSFMEGTFKGGIYKFGLDFEAVGYSDEAGNLSPEVKALADKYASAILAGNLYVPENREQFEEFQVPEDILP